MGRVVTGDLVLRTARPEDAAACAAIFNGWVDATDWMPRVHPPEDVARFYREHVMATCTVTIAEAAGRVAGFLAVDGEGFVAGLYLAPEARGRGVGRALLAEAKVRRPEGLTLWAFVANQGARRFYAREGFVEVRRTEGENEEKLPDVLLAWKPA
jgi:ribosomal protein S18 acetylase RimI-like enzyme